jgi:hypothetical protein
MTSEDHNHPQFDPFCGCGTTIDAAEKLGRDWIGIDVTQLAISLIKNRLQDTYGGRLKFVSGPTAVEKGSARVPRAVSGVTPDTSDAYTQSNAQETSNEAIGATPMAATGTVALPEPDVHLVRIIGEPTTPNEAATLAEDDKF